MDFYHTPTTCAQATHILLREAGLPFTPRKVDIFTGTLEDGSHYASVNPNGYVPALVLDDGLLLTENAAILDWIASQRPSMLPAGEMGRTRHLQMLAFISTELQKPFVRLFFTESAEEQATLRDVLPRRFRWIAGRMEGEHIFGAAFTGADAFLYVMLRWAMMVGIETPEVLDAFAARVEQRYAVRTVLMAEAVEPLRPAA